MTEVRRRTGAEVSSEDQLVSVVSCSVTAWSAFSQQCG